MVTVTTESVRQFNETGILDSSVYTDVDIFEWEMHQLFQRSWVYVAHESQVAQPGDYFTTRVGREPVIVTRGEDGIVRVLRNRCLHKGSLVCHEVSGNAAFFRCPYHAWTYRNTGEVLGVLLPNGYRSSGVDLRSGKLAEAAEVATFAGFIFALMEEGDRGLLEHLGRAAEYLERFSQGTPGHDILLRGTPYRYKYRGNWKLQYENTLEAYHAPPLHDGFFKIIAKRTGASSVNPFRDDGAVTTLDLGDGHGGFLHNGGRTKAIQENSPPGDSYYDRARLSPGGERLLSNIESRIGRDETLRLLEPGSDFNIGIFPNLQIVQGQIRVLFPVDVNQTEVEAYVSVPDGAPPEITQLRMRIVETFWGPAGHGSPDDSEMFERVQEGLKSQRPEVVFLSRGLEREVEEDGVRTSRASDEGPLRSFYREWFRWLEKVPPEERGNADKREVVKA